MKLITNPVESLHTQNILKGVDIILKYNPLGTFSALHDILFFGDLSIKNIEVSEEDKVLLEKLDWFLDEEFSDGEWAIYV